MNTCLEVPRVNRTVWSFVIWVTPTVECNRYGRRKTGLGVRRF